MPVMYELVPCFPEVRQGGYLGPVGGKKVVKPEVNMACSKLFQVLPSSASMIDASDGSGVIAVQEDLS